MLLRIPSSLNGSLLSFFSRTCSEALVRARGTWNWDAGMRLEPSDRGKAVRRPPDPAAGRPGGRGCHQAAGGVENDALKDSFVSER